MPRERRGRGTCSRIRASQTDPILADGTAITNSGLYLNPLLVRGEPVEGVNDYRRWPTFDPDETIRFAGHEDWDARAERLNAEYAFVEGDSTETPLEVTMRMIDRLRAGTVKQ